MDTRAKFFIGLTVFSLIGISLKNYQANVQRAAQIVYATQCAVRKGDLTKAQSEKVLTRGLDRLDLPQKFKYEPAVLTNAEELMEDGCNAYDRRLRQARAAS